MPKNRPLILFIILAGLALLVIWIPVVQQMLPSPGIPSAFSIDTWIILSLFASTGIVLLFLVLYILTRGK